MERPKYRNALSAPVDAEYAEDAIFEAVEAMLTFLLPFWFGCR
jgi:hypothetical protein